MKLIVNGRDFTALCTELTLEDNIYAASAVLTAQVVFENHDGYLPPIFAYCGNEVVLEEGWTYSPKMLVGAWDFQYEMTGEYYGYRFNEDGTLDELYNRMHIPMGYYKCEIDGVHYSPDGENWDELVMVVKSLTKDELVVDFGGMETVYKRYEGETKDYMPAGWQYVEGTDDEIGADVSAETDE